MKVQKFLLVAAFVSFLAACEQKKAEEKVEDAVEVVKEDVVAPVTEAVDSTAAKVEEGVKDAAADVKEAVKEIK